MTYKLYVVIAMKRKSAFEQYLKNNGLSTKYAGYCENHIEVAFNIDMDDIIVSHQNISRVRQKLENNGIKKNCVDQYMTALNYYLKFAFEQGMIASSTVTSTTTAKTSSSTSPIATPSPLISTPAIALPMAGINRLNTPCVVYCDDVPLEERDENFRQALEDEYPKILDFARKILGIDYGYIPVYLSPKMPTSDFKVNRNYFKNLCKKIENQQEITDIEYRIYQAGIFHFNVIGRFFPGERPYIEIYYRNISKTRQYTENAINCLAHEYMHFLHYAYAPIEFYTSLPCSPRVKEALAEFFGILYSINRGGKNDVYVAEDIYRTLIALKGSGWEYTYALYFYKVRGKTLNFTSIFNDYISHGCIDKLLRVFSASNDIKYAYEFLKVL